MNRFLNLFALAAGMVGMAVPASSRSAAAARPAAAPAGYLYTVNNDPSRNGVAVFERHADGALAEVPGSPFATGGKGIALPAGADVDDQGAVRVSGDFVLAVNTGSNNIAVLRKRGGGRLEPVNGSPFPANGANPVSVAVRNDLVYVANQALPFAHPQKAPNITGFRLQRDGQLVPIPGSTVEFPSGHGPAEVEFHPAGGVLVATAGFQEASTSQLRSFLVQPDGTLREGPGSPLIEKGATGDVGFSWDRTRDRIYVSNFRGSAVTIYDVDPSTAAIHPAMAEVPDGESAACWTAVSADGKRLYVANFVSNSVSAYAIGSEGKLQLLGSARRRMANEPDTKDIAVSPDGKYLYAVAPSAGRIAVFRLGAGGGAEEIGASGSLVRVGSGQAPMGIAVE